MTTTEKLLANLAKTRQNLAARGGNYERPVRLAAPKNTIRILPSWTGEIDGPLHQDFGMHWIKGSDGKVIAGFVCTQVSFGEPCEVCDQLAHAALHNTDEHMANVIKEARAAGRILVNAIYRNGTHANAKTDPVILELPATVFQQILDTAFEYLDQHGINIFDLNEGYDLTVTKTGSGRDTKYGVVISPKATAVDESIMSKVKDLTAHVRGEYERAKTRALSTVRAATGLAALPAPAPAAGSSGPAFGGPGASRPAAGSTLAETRPETYDEAEEVAYEEKPARPAPRAAAVTRPAPASDDVLAELEGLLD